MVTLEISLYDYYQELKKKNILFSYSGPVSQDSLEGVAGSLRRNLEYQEAGNKTTLSVFSIFVEQVQNILNYSAENLGPPGKDECELRFGVIVICRGEGGDYYIYCGNRVYNKDVPGLGAKVEEVRRLDRDELKALYKKRRKMAPGLESKGAGLGIIEMARKAGSPLEYSFVTIDDTYSFFSIKVMVRRQADEGPVHRSDKVHPPC